jgi:hypothetical protein
VVVLFSDISRALYRVLVNTFPEINLLFMGRGTSQAQQHQISVVKNRWQSCKMNKGGAPSGQLKILEFSVSEAGGGKDLTDSLIMQQKQRIREGLKSTAGSDVRMCGDGSKGRGAG